MKNILFLILLLFLSLEIFSQKQAAIWYFGDYAGLDFNSGGPVALTNSAMYQPEGCATIADAGGNLMFYTNGMTVWNKNHQEMVNGSGLMGHPSSAQSSIIVPVPGNQNLYYIFTVDAEISYDGGLRYSVVDMSQDNGNGAVTSDKNIFLAAPTEEKVTAVRHANGTDIWVITHLWDSDIFLTYLITKNGISSPVQTNVGSFHSGIQGETHSYMKASPDGKKLAIIVRPLHTFELFDFDAATGIISNPLTFDQFDGLLYGIAFSQDSKKIYLSNYLAGSNVYQYDLSAGSPQEIINSKVLIGSVSNYHNGELQLAIDGKIYLSKHTNLNGDEYLGVINFPDMAGVNCGFVEDGFYLEGKKCIYGLPNFIQSYFFDLSFTWENVCFSDTTNFAPNRTDVDSVLWDFGDVLSGGYNHSKEMFPGHIFSSPGTYLVTLFVWINGYAYSTSNYVTILKKPFVDLGPDTSICSDNGYLLHAGPGYNSYLWQDGSADSVYLVDTSGVYWVTVENECGTASDTVEIDYVESFQIDLGPDTSFCYGKSITLSPGSGYINYYWQDGSGNTAYVATQSGIYWVQVTDSAGCTASDTVTVETFMTFDFSIGNDTTICDGDYIFLNGPEGYAAYLWQDGSNYNSFIADTAGIYWLEITDTNNCAARDSLLLQTDKVPAGILGTDTLMCKDSVKVLRTVPAFEQYFWQDGSQDSIYIASESGKYWVMVFDTLGCSGSDTITLTYYPAVTLELKREGYLCEDDSVLFTAISNYDSFIWQDSSTNNYFVAKDSGTYWVSVTNGCETKLDTIIIDACSSIWIPNVFTPNNDGYNDYFYAVAKNISKFKMEIFNRWGQVLAVLNSIDEKWDGTYKGRPVAEGTYFWIADFEQINSRGVVEKKRLQGSLTLLR